MAQTDLNSPWRSPAHLQSNCNNSGIAVISFDLFATLHCPRCL